MYELIVSGSVLILLVGGIVGYQIYDIRKVKECHKEDMGKMENKIVLRDPCIERHIVINNRLNKGEGNFDKIMDTLKTYGETLVRIDERTKALAKKNGVNTD